MRTDLDDQDIENLADLRVSEDESNPFRTPKMRAPPARGKSIRSRHTDRPNQVLSEVQPTIKSTKSNNAVESYFMRDDKRWGLSKTTGHTLSDLCTKSGNGIVDPVTIEEHISRYNKAANVTRLNSVQVNLGNLFANWPIYLREGFNILVYGVGSKHELLENFRKSHLPHSHCIVVPAYNPSINIRHVLQSICHDWLLLPDSIKKPSDQLRHIITSMNKSGAESDPLYLIVHNIDGPGLRSAKAQTILAHLASLPFVHLIASIDHINIPVLWSHNELARFCWIWEDCTTLLPYAQEANFSNNSMLQTLLAGISEYGSMGVGNSGTALASLRQVAASLTQNARDIFRLIAEHQLNAPLHETRGTNVGMPLEDLYWRCRDAFLANSETTLRAQLTEFRDHKLLRIRKGPDGTELLTIPMDNASLRKFVDNFDTFC